MNPFDKKLKKLFSYQLDPLEAVEKAFEFLEGEDIPLTEDQQTAVMFLVDMAYRNVTDSWDHEFQGTARVKKLLKSC